MPTPKPVSVGLVGTSWWADAMYLPALKDHPLGQITALCGRNRENTRRTAGRWNIPHVFTDYGAMIDSGLINAVIVATLNDTHYPITMRALEAGLHVLCEKPLGLTYAEAKGMADLAAQKGVKHMTPFTYRFMPTARYLKELIDGGYIGQPYHLNMRYYTGYGRSGDYNSRFDVGKSGAGAVADIGSHFMYLARWYFGEIVGIYAQFGYMLPRPPLDPEGKPYELGEETAMVLLTFENGAQGSLTVSTLCYEGTSFGQTHHFEFHGSEGTLYNLVDWDRVQRVSGTRQGEGPAREMPIPDRVWGGARRDTVHNTYRDVFRTQDFMARGFVTAIAEDRAVEPSFHDGARIQYLIEAAVKSNRERCWVDVRNAT
jgi:predicted dehydrogenase